jgi:poly(3-hydroxybutyrate) depolymerase
MTTELDETVPIDDARDDADPLAETATLVEASSSTQTAPADPDRMRRLSDEDADELIGRQLEHFQIEATVGSGGMGSVYRQLLALLVPLAWVPLALTVVALTACSDDTAGHRDDFDTGLRDTSSDAADARDSDSFSDTTSDTTSDTAADTASDAPEADASTPSRCTVEPDTIRCTRNTEVFDTGFGDYESREVHWQVPVGEAPEQGWPAAILFQGSFYSSERYWEGDRGAVMGLFHRARAVQMLLDAGFAVITPEAQFNGTTYWNTNVAPYATSWSLAPDHEFMLDIFAAIEAGDFGQIDDESLYAGGISSGGYMTSRMAEAYPGRFKALAILSASYCWCAGSTCYVPASLPDDHPPTLFVHGQLDTVVPAWTMTPYEDGLSDDGVDTRVIIDSTAGHEWVEQAPAAIVEWFETH